METQDLMESVLGRINPSQIIFAALYISRSLSSSQFCISLTVIFLLQLAAGILGFIFSDKVMKQ